MNEKDYPVLFKAVGAFDVFKSNYYSGSYVRALCRQNDHERIQMIAHRLVDLNNTYFLENPANTLYHSLRRRTISDKRSKSSLHEIALETSLKPAEVVDWLERNTLDIEQFEPEKRDFDPEKLSVGPCRYQDKNTEFVKVRFQGYSIPFYFSKGGQWERAATLAAAKAELPNDPGTVQEIIELFASNSTVDRTTAADIIEKAQTRPMNKSQIVESGSFSPKFYVPVSYKNIRITKNPNTWETEKADFDGYKSVVEKNEMAVPGLIPVAVFNFTCQPTKDQYGYSRRNHLLVVVTEDKVYSVKRYYHWRGQSNRNKSPHTDPNAYLAVSEDMYYLRDESYIKMSDLKVLDEEDAFVRERAGRALSRKL